MKIGIIFAMQEEIEAFIHLFDKSEAFMLEDLQGIHITHQGKDIFALRSGVGKVNAAYATTLLTKKCEILLNSGVAGGINIERETIVLGEELIYHDVDVTAFRGYQKGQIPGLPVLFKGDQQLLDLALSLNHEVTIGLIASGDQFMVSKDPLKELIKNYPKLYAIDMEAAAIAHIAHLKAIPFLAIRTITDLLGETSQEDNFESFLQRAALKSATLLKSLIDAL